MPLACSLDGLECSHLEKLKSGTTSKEITADKALVDHLVLFVRPDLIPRQCDDLADRRKLQSDRLLIGVLNNTLVALPGTFADVAALADEIDVPVDGIKFPLLLSGGGIFYVGDSVGVLESSEVVEAGFLLEVEEEAVVDVFDEDAY